MDGVMLWAEAFWSMLAESGLWLVGGFFVAGLIKAYVSQASLTKHLGKPGIWSVVKSSAIGVPMPLCSCSVIPTAAALRKSGASRGASASFAISTPEIDVPGIAITWGLMGPVMAIARPITAFASAVAAGFAIDVSDRNDATLAIAQDPKPAPDQIEAKGSCCSPELDSDSADEMKADGCCADKGTSGCCSGSKSGEEESVRSSKLVMALREGFLDMPMHLAFWLVVGLGLSALVTVIVPNGWFEGTLGNGIVSKLAMLVVGLPMYVCSTSSTPFAAALITSGLSPGAALVFLLAGPATNPATMGWVLKDLGVRSLVIYLVMISLFAVLMGVLVDAFIPSDLIRVVELTGEHSHQGLWHTVGGITLGALLTVALIRKYATRLMPW